MYYLGARRPIPEALFMTAEEFVRDLLEQADEARLSNDHDWADHLVTLAREEIAA